ncbi:MAG: hypothetical protein EP330_04065 [Deltaproteobacteria bacterium]|nr:MAG: hypothetical protein EP330_04065 [Deltaproteobacteria bacterium]
MDKLAIGVLAGLAGLGLGWIVFAPAPTTAVPTASEAAPAKTETRVVTEDCGALEAELAALKRTSAFQDAMLSMARTRLDGVAMTWPDAVPAEQEPDEVLAALEASVEACGLPLDVMTAECSEPPCILTAADHSGGTAYGFSVSCPTWAERYPSTHVSGQVVDCGDHEEQVLFVAAGWEGLDEGDPENLQLRLAARQQQLVDAWVCTPQ